MSLTSHHNPSEKLSTLKGKNSVTFSERVVFIFRRKNPFQARTKTNFIEFPTPIYITSKNTSPVHGCRLANADNSRIISSKNIL